MTSVFGRAFVKACLREPLTGGETESPAWVLFTLSPHHANIRSWTGVPGDASVISSAARYSPRPVWKSINITRGIEERWSAMMRRIVRLDHVSPFPPKNSPSGWLYCPRLTAVCSHRSPLFTRYQAIPTPVFRSCQAEREAGSITQAAQVCLDHGAAEVYACAIHPVLSGPAVARLDASPFREVVVTNSIAVPESKRFPKLTVLSVATMLGETIQRIHTGASVSATQRSADYLATMG